MTKPKTKKHKLGNYVFITAEIGTSKDCFADIIAVDYFTAY